MEIENVNLKVPFAAITFLEMWRQYLVGTQFGGQELFFAATLPSWFKLHFHATTIHKSEIYRVGWGIWNQSISLPSPATAQDFLLPSEYLCWFWRVSATDKLPLLLLTPLFPQDQWFTITGVDIHRVLLEPNPPTLRIHGNWPYYQARPIMSRSGLNLSHPQRWAKVKCE